MTAPAPSVERLGVIVQKASYFLRCLSEANLAGGRTPVPLFPNSKTMRETMAFQAFTKLEWELNPRRIPFGQNGRKGVNARDWPEPLGMELVHTLMALLDGVDEVLTRWGIQELCGGEGYSIGGRLTPGSKFAPGIVHVENPVGYLTPLPSEVIDPLFHTVGTLQEILTVAKSACVGQPAGAQQQQVVAPPIAAEQSQGKSQLAAPSDPNPRPYQPSTPPRGSNPYLMLRHILHELFWLAAHAQQGQDVFQHINPTTAPWDDAESQARACSAGWGIPFTTFDPILTEAKRTMRELVQIAAGNTSVPFSGTDTRYALLEERLQELANSIPVFAGDSTPADVATPETNAQTKAAIVGNPSETLRTPDQLLHAFGKAAARFSTTGIRVAAFLNAARADGLTTIPASLIPKNESGQPLIGQLDIGGTGKTTLAGSVTYYGVGGARSTSAGTEVNVGFVIYGQSPEDDAVARFRELGSEAGVISHLHGFGPAIQSYDNPLALWATIVYSTLHGSAWLSKLKMVTETESHHFNPFTASAEVLKRLVAQVKTRPDEVALAGNPPGPATKQDEGDKPGTKPDGPFDADGFRFAGVEVKFGKAGKQYRLVMALWDAKKSRPTPPRPVEDVITEVWGDENETEDSTFRQLCADTRRKFQAALCPLDIQQMNGKVQLSRL